MELSNCFNIKVLHFLKMSYLSLKIFKIFLQNFYSRMKSIYYMKQAMIKQSFHQNLLKLKYPRFSLIIIRNQCFGFQLFWLFLYYFFFFDFLKSQIHRKFSIIFTLAFFMQEILFVGECFTFFLLISYWKGLFTRGFQFFIYRFIRGMEY